jgi:hypothetical protein
MTIKAPINTAIDSTKVIANVTNAILTAIGDRAVIDSFENALILDLSEYKNIELESYAKDWQSTSDGPIGGGARYYKTGVITPASAGTGTPFSFFDGIGNEYALAADQEINPLMIGAVGDNVATDDDAFNLIEASDYDWIYLPEGYTFKTTFAIGSLSKTYYGPGAINFNGSVIDYSYFKPDREMDMSRLILDDDLNRSISSSNLDNGTIQILTGGSSRLSIDSDEIFSGTGLKVGSLSGNLSLLPGSGVILIPQRIAHNGDENTYFEFQSNDVISLSTSGTERLRIDTAETTVNNLLKINVGGVRRATFDNGITTFTNNPTVEISDNAITNVIINSTSSRAGLVLAHADTVQGALHTASTGLRVGYGAGWASNISMHINNTNGFVGIKRTDPSQALDVNGNVRANVGLFTTEVQSDLFTAFGDATSFVDLGYDPVASNAVGIGTNNSMALMFDVNNNSTTLAFTIGHNGQVGDASYEELIRIDGGTSFTYKGNQVYHQGFEGAGSGLDADTVDGLQASQFVRSDTDDTVLGALTFTNILPAVDVRRGIHGSYGQTAGTGNNWGANIWSIGRTFGGSGFGSTYDINNNYGISWLRGDHPDRDTRVAEGFYVHSVGTQRAAIGSLGISTSGDLWVDGGDIVLGGTGRIQGVDTVTANTDAANKQYVDAAVGTALPLTQINVNLQLTTGWINTGIDGTDLDTGTYIVQLFADDNAVGGGHFDEYYSGTMSWYAGATNSTVTDEIVLHRAGHAPNNGKIFLRVKRNNSGILQLQISSTVNTTGTSTYQFKFRKMI